MMMLRSPFSQLLATLTLCISLSTTLAEILTFEDDRGVTHTWDNDNKAKICVRASTGGLSLVQMGMTSEQLVCYWGLWGVRGSDFDPENPEAGSIFPEVDPTPEEAAAFENGVNLSPSCWKNPRGCYRWDSSNRTDLVNMVESGEVDFVLHIDNGNDYSFSTLERQSGIRTIFVDTYFEKHDRCRAESLQILNGNYCYGRSMMDIAQRIEELAIFLGVDVDVPAVQTSKQDACDAAVSFAATMEELHARDMRIKVSIFGTEEYPEGSGVEVPYARDFDPITLWVPRTLEELGAPLLHGSEGNIVVDRFFVDCDDGLVNETCRDNTYHPVDFWLIDSRSYLLVEDWVNSNLFPDPAIMAGQYSYYPRNDGAISYRTIANLLNMYNERLSSAVKVSRTDPGTCTAVDPKSYEVINYRNGGLGLNDFICYDYDLIQEEYLTCLGYQEGFRCDICPEQVIANPDNVVSFFGFEMTCGGAATYITNTAPVLGLTPETLCPLVLPSIPQFSCCGAPETDNSDATSQNDASEASETDTVEATPAPENAFCDICPGEIIVNPDNVVSMFGITFTCEGAADFIANSATLVGLSSDAVCPLLLPTIPQFSCCGPPGTENSDATPAPQNDACDICPEEIIVNPDNVVSLFGLDFTCEGAADFIANSATFVGLSSETVCPLVIAQITQFSCCGAPETDNSGATPVPQNDAGEPSGTDNSDANDANDGYNANDASEASETENSDVNAAMQNDASVTPETDNSDTTPVPQNNSIEASDTGDSDADPAPQNDASEALETDNSDESPAPQNDEGEPSETDNIDESPTPQNDDGEPSETDNSDESPAPQNDAVFPASETDNSDETPAPENNARVRSETDSSAVFHNAKGAFAILFLSSAISVAITFLF